MAEGGRAHYAGASLVQQTLEDGGGGLGCTPVEAGTSAEKCRQLLVGHCTLASLVQRAARTLRQAAECLWGRAQSHMQLCHPLQHSAGRCQARETLQHRCGLGLEGGLQLHEQRAAGLAPAHSQRGTSQGGRCCRRRPLPYQPRHAAGDRIRQPCNGRPPCGMKEPVVFGAAEEQAQLALVQLRPRLAASGAEVLEEHVVA
mmetsp:Transcript_26904/g.80171  ORF Transcript_26904/g.80171 Transcript_26904/m.80171 type:complete len:201 (+) Transcript_26904:310-912(+)